MERRFERETDHGVTQREWNVHRKGSEKAELEEFSCGEVRLQRGTNRISSHRLGVEKREQHKRFVKFTRSSSPKTERDVGELDEKLTTMKPNMMM